MGAFSLIVVINLLNRLSMGRRTKNANPSPIRKGVAELSNSGEDAPLEEDISSHLSQPEFNIDSRSFSSVTQIVPKVVHSNDPNYYPAFNTNQQRNTEPVMQGIVHRSAQAVPQNGNATHTRSVNVRKFLPSLIDMEISSVESIDDIAQKNIEKTLTASSLPVRNLIAGKAFYVPILSAGIDGTTCRQPTKRRLELDTAPRVVAQKVNESLSESLKRRKDGGCESSTPLTVSESWVVESIMPPSVKNCSLQLQPVTAATWQTNGNSSNGLSVEHKLCRVVNSTATEMRSMHIETDAKVDLTQKNDGSLTQTAKRFVEFIQKSSKPEVDLNMMALKLQCPKRRLYDITNVLEGIGLLEKVSKNKVQWTSKDVDFSHVAVANMRTDLNDLRKKETQLENSVKLLQSMYEKEIEDCINNRFGYVTSDSVRKLDLGTNRRLIFANGPKSTELAIFSPEKVSISSQSGPIEICITSTDDIPKAPEVPSTASAAPTLQYGETGKVFDAAFLAELARKIEEYSNSTKSDPNETTRPSSSIGSLPRSGCGSNRISPIDDVSRDSGLDSPSITAGLGRLATPPVLPFTPVHQQHFSVNGKDATTSWASASSGIQNMLDADGKQCRQYSGFTPVQNSMLAMYRGSVVTDQLNVPTVTSSETLMPFAKVPRLTSERSFDSRPNLTPIVLKKKQVGPGIECSFTPIKAAESSQQGFEPALNGVRPHSKQAAASLFQ